MPNYYVNKNTQPKSGDNEVHLSGEDDCDHHADAKNRVDLGWHKNCSGAVQMAKNLGYHANGCYYCANDCHTT